MKVNKIRFRNLCVQDIHYLITSEFLLNDTEQYLLLPESFNAIIKEGVDEICLQLDSDNVALQRLDNSRKLKLGHYAEDLMDMYFQKHPAIEVLEKNWQINKDGITQGELDFIIKVDGQIIGIEMAFKCYVQFSKGLNGWEGPNRRDSLKRKLKKVKDKQLPLFNYPEVEMKYGDIQSYFFLKGHLFANQPYNGLEVGECEFDYLYLSCIDHLFDHNGRYFLYPKSMWISGLYYSRPEYEIQFDEIIELLTTGWENNKTYILGVRTKTKMNNYFVLKDELSEK